MQSCEKYTLIAWCGAGACAQPGGVPDVQDYNAYADAADFQNRQDLQHVTLPAPGAQAGLHLIGVYNNDAYLREAAAFSIEAQVQGWEDDPACAFNCSGSGACTDLAVCECDLGFAGDFCEVRRRCCCRCCRCCSCACMQHALGACTHAHLWTLACMARCMQTGGETGTRCICAGKTLREDLMEGLLCAGHLCQHLHSLPTASAGAPAAGALGLLPAHPGPLRLLLDGAHKVEPLPLNISHLGQSAAHSMQTCTCMPTAV
jgi:hypothetical protein